MEIVIDGQLIKTEQDFHRFLSMALKVEEFYGGNLHALWDLLSAGVERPLMLIWNQSDISKKFLGEDFSAIVEVLQRVKLQDEEFGWKEKFLYLLK